MKVIYQPSDSGTSGSGKATKLFSNTATTTIANTGTETTLLPTLSGSNSIAANTLVAGDILRLKIGGKISTAVSAGNMTLKVYWGSTVLLNTNATGLYGNSVTTKGWGVYCDFVVKSIGSSGTISCVGFSHFNTFGGLYQDGLNSGSPTTFSQTIATDATTTFDVKWTWTTPSSSNTITTEYALLERITA